ncbi:unnamed protein product, partial [Darwinula stevensoni]
VIFGAANFYHTSEIFEKTTQFSYLSEREREITFKTENGFYYRYYKILTSYNEKPFSSRLEKFFADNLTEYPSTIQPIKRFNVYPEVMLVLGSFYLVFEKMITSLNMTFKECWDVSRGPGFPPIQSCIGIQEPMYFYLNCIWFLAAITTVCIFLTGASLGSGLFGGLVAVVCFFFNHGESTRVQTYPPLRESFGFPFFMMHHLCITKVLQSQQVTWQQLLALSSLTAAFLLSWQFGQFVVLVQIYVIFFLHVMHLISFNQSLCLALAICKHIVDLLKMKLGRGSDFSSLLYLSQAEFQSLPSLTVAGYSSTLLLPSVIVAVTFCILHFLRSLFIQRQKQRAETSSQSDVSSHVPHVYHVIMLGAFAVMAGVFMRLKLFLTPQMCIVTSLLASRRHIPIKQTSMHAGLLALLLAGMAVQGVSNLKKQYDVSPCGGLAETEELLNWIDQIQPEGAFAGNMNIMASILLSTERPIVNHPQFEDEGVRNRTMAVYRIFSRQPAMKVYQVLHELQVSFIVIINQSVEVLGGIWDILEPRILNWTPLYELLVSGNPHPFKRVFQNEVYTVIQMPLKAIEFRPPRSYKA